METAIEDDEKVARIEPYLNAFWNAVNAGRLSLAYHLICLIRESFSISNIRHPSPSLMELATLSSHITSDRDNLVQDFVARTRTVIEELENTKPKQESDDINVLLLCSAIQPAIFAPQTGALTLMQKVKLPDQWTDLNEMVNLISQFARDMQNVGLDTSRVKTTIGSVEWDSILDEHIQQVENWFESARNRRTKYKPAAHVWRQCLAKDGILSGLRDAVTTKIETEKTLDEVTEIVERLSSEATIEKLIQQRVAHAGAMNRHSTIRLIKKHLLPLFHEAADFGRVWVNLIESRPRTGQFVEQKILDFRSSLMELIPATSKQIEKLIGGSKEIGLQASLVLLRQRLGDLADLFDTDGQSSTNLAMWNGQLSTDRLLNEDLLYASELDLPYEDVMDSATVLDRLVDPSSFSKDLAKSFERRIKRDDIAGAELVLERLDEDKELDTSEFHESLERAIYKKKIEYERLLDALSLQLQDAHIANGTNENEFDSFNSSIVNLKGRVSSNESSIHDLRGAIHILDRDITTRFDAALKALTDEVLGISTSLGDTERSLIDQSIVDEDIATLIEYRDCVIEGRALPASASERTDHFTNFLKFKSVFNASRIQDLPTSSDIVAYVDQGNDVLGLPFSNLDESDRPKAKELLSLWYEMDRNKLAVDGKVVGEFFKQLGFSLIQCSLERHVCFTLLIEPLRHRDVCPVYSFGSDANGRYTILLNWRTAEAETDLIQLLNRDSSQCVIVLNFGRVDRKSDWLRAHAERNKLKLLSVDETLVLYLASLPQRSVRSLFDCTLPFSSIEPFFTGSGLVPRESFFGRESDLNSVTEPRGSCFVYGGRQLGKTALLRAAEARFNERGPHQVAIYIDLKTEEIGARREPSSIWQVVWDRLTVEEIVPKAGRRVQDPNRLSRKIQDAVKEWLGEGETGSRRILLLLDEADDFLKTDFVQGFAASTQLKGLMDDTDRGFQSRVLGIA